VKKITFLKSINFFVDKGNELLYSNNNEGNKFIATKSSKEYFLNFFLDNLQNQLDNRELHNILVL